MAKIKFPFSTVALLIYCFHGYAQSSKVYGTIIDEKSKEPVSYATITVSKQPVGTYANNSGYFELFVPGFSDSLSISAIGYESLTIALHNFQNDTKIYLSKSPQELDPVKVSGYNGKVQTIGVKPTKVRNSINIFPGSEYVYRFIAENNSNKRIVRFRFHTNDRGIVQKAIYRINLYTVDKNGEPDSLINTRDHLIEVDTSNGLYDINLYSDQYYIGKQGLFIGIESIGYLDSNGKYTYGNAETPLYFKFNTDKSDQPKCYRRINKYQWLTIREGMSKNPDKPFLIPCFEIDVAE